MTLTQYRRRAVAGAQADFARQLAERNQTGRPTKKFKTSAPRGVKLGQGYVDRAHNRESNEEDDREERLKALEESLKKEEIDPETYENLRLQIAGGDLESTHLVKGLDFKLLERIRKGEDVYSAKEAESTDVAEPEGDENADDAFDELESREVEALAKEKAEKKKGQLSTVSLAPGKKRTRDQILAELKAAREAAKAQQEPALGDRFRKIGSTQKLGTRIERDSKGREVLIIVDADGHEKRKVRKINPGDADDARSELLVPDKSAKPLGMEVPEQYKKPEAPAVEEDDGEVNIFDDAGDDYDPLAGLDASDSDSDDSDKPDKEASDSKRNNMDEQTSEKAEASSLSMPPPAKPQAPVRNYFKDAKTGLISEEATRGPSMSDPAIMAAIKKAATLRQIESEEDEKSNKEAKEAEERRKKLIQRADRDDDDLDMGFGTSRYEDDDDLEDHELATWGEGDEGEGGSGKGGGKSQRKRGPKKRKGDVNSAADVLRVMDQRKNKS